MMRLMPLLALEIGWTMKLMCSPEVLRYVHVHRRILLQ
jgi:hypothetical protein